MEFTVAITGASGSIYAQRTLVHMAASGVVERINLILESLVDHLVFRILDHLGVPHSQATQWKGLKQQSGQLLGLQED